MFAPRYEKLLFVILIQTHVTSEIMFNPELADLDFPPLQRMVFDSLMKTDFDCRAELNSMDTKYM